MSAIEYGPLAPLLDDPTLTEIMVNGHREVYVERGGVIEATDVRFADEGELITLIEQVAAYVGRRASAQDAMLDARLPDGSRVNVVLPPLSLSGPVVTIRRFVPGGVTAEDLIDRNSATPAAIDFLHACVLARRNMLISGRSGVGKTTMLNILSKWIADRERIITIEDSAELQLSQPHWVRLETRPADMNGRHEATSRHLVRNALRMRPDRIVIGEVRGGEALDMLQAMNTGHDGSMSTIHANSSRDALYRLETLVLMAGVDLPQRAVRDQIATAVNLLIHLGRTDMGQRRIEQISEVVGREGDVVTLQDIFTMQSRTEPDGRTVEKLMPTRVRPLALDHMVSVKDSLPPGLHRVYPDPRLTASESAA
ncbi:MAG TPA: CpaF family protein [Candidatus Dormibacteraeota bacterium]|jgi:pilus assembly protein CpaF|nr:CpaF family protein [Candidatus Dormibacteraeota bacterium]